MILLRIVIFLLSLGVVLVTLLSAIKTFILPRPAPDLITRLVFLSVRFFFRLRLRLARSYLEKDRIMAFYAPVGLLALLPVWALCILGSYTAMFWAIGVTPLSKAFELSGSSIFTLGFAGADTSLQAALAFSESSLGLIVVALLVAYLPSLYATFSRRESAVTLLEVRAGAPPSAVELIKRYHRIHGFNRLHELWQNWEGWFAEVEESHTSFPVLAFFRSPRPDHSWVTAAGAILDAAALVLAVVDTPYDPQAALTLRAGYLALRHIADFFGVPYNSTPQPEDPASVTRADFDTACAELAAGGVPLKADVDQGWRAFNGWRVNYDTVLLALAALVVAPPALWSGDRPIYYHVPAIPPRARDK